MKTLQDASGKCNFADDPCDDHDVFMIHDTFV